MIARAAGPGVRRRRARLLLQAALAGVVLATLVHTRADPDLWGHVAFGRDIVADRSIPSADIYSFTSDIPWVNHEWLAEVAMYAAYAALGGPGLIALKVTLVLLALWVAARTLRVDGVEAPGRHVLLAIAAVASIQQANAMRPQIFSILLFAALLAVTVRVERGHIRAVAWLPPIFLAWVNLHGGWIVGGGVLALWATVRLIETRADRLTRVAFAASAASAVATFINPYGWGMWSFLLETVRPVRAEIADWQPVYLLGPGAYFTWAALVSLAALALWRAPRRPPLARVLIVVVLAIGAFRVNRLLMFLAIAVTVLLGREVLALLPRRDRTREAGESDPGVLSQVVALALAVAVLLGALTMTARYGRCVIVEQEQWPEPEAVRLIRTHAPRGRMLTWFGWGEYAIWYLAPDIKISMDGRRETVYSPPVLDEHLRFYFDGSNARRYLEAHHIDYVWLPTTLPVVPLLESDSQLRMIYRGPRSVLFTTARTGVPERQSLSIDPQPRLARCFPGP